MFLDGINIDQLWGSALAAVPLAIGVWALCRFGRFRPATRHILWVIVLVSLVTPIAAGVLGMPRLPIERWLGATAATPAEPLAGPETAEGAPGIGSNVDLVWDPFPWLIDRAAWEATPTSPAGPRMLESLLAHAERGPGSNRSGPEAGAASTFESSDVRGEAIDRSAQTNGPHERTTGTDRKRGDSFAADELRRWSAAMVDVRDAVAAIPPVPSGVWLGGILAAIAWRVVRIGLFVRAMGAGESASAATRALVADVAAEVGLGRAPLTLMLDRRVSPLVWCGWRPRLVLPVGLWDELDSAGRRAVLMHELAHLKRRDHLVVWLSQAVSLVYWWHPVVWWACRRIDEEADFACDAWVTAMRPAGRRVYAETLVVAKSYVSGPGMSRAPGLAMASHSARQLSRRLTMVMTQRTSPGLSTLGVILAAGVAAAGVFITPTLACSVDGRAEAGLCPPVQPTAVTPQEGPTPPTQTVSLIADLRLATDAEPLVAKLAAPTPLGLVGTSLRAPTTFESYMTVADQPDQPDHPDLRELLRRIEQLEKALRELREHAAPRADAGGGGARGLALPARTSVLARNAAAAALSLSRQNAAVRGGALTSLGAIARNQAAAAAVQATGAREGPLGWRNVQPGASTGGGRAAPFGRSLNRATERADDSESIAISYTLSPGKLGALTDLMAREDVPVLIERDKGRITVHGTRRQHEIFGAFVRMIEPESASEPRGSGRRGAPQADRSRGIDTRPERTRINATRLASDAVAPYTSILAGRDKIEAERSELERHARSLTVTRARLEQQLGTARIEAGKVRLNLQGRVEDARKSGKRGVGRSEGEAGQLQRLLERKEADARAASDAAKSLDDTLSELRARIVDLEDRAAVLRRQGEDLERRIRRIDRSR